MKNKTCALLKFSACTLTIVLLGQGCVERHGADSKGLFETGVSQTSRDQKLVDQASEIKDALTQSNSAIAKRRGEYQKSEAHSELAVAYKQQKAYRAKHGSYSDDPEVVFESLLATPRMTLRYVYGLRPSCSASAGSDVVTILSVQKNPMAPETNDALEAIQTKLKNLEIPCKPLKQGFTLLAIGTVRGATQLDIWSIDEREKLVSVQDGLEEAQ